MSTRKLFCLIIILLFSVHLFAYQQRASPVTTLTLWLMPAQPAEEDTPVSGPKVEEEIEIFNKEFGKASIVTVVNTTDPWLRAQLKVWNQEYAGPSWPIVKGQIETLKLIAKFAQEKNVHINVRFLNWSIAFKELEQAAINKRDGKSSPGGPPPDVAQVGSTWVAYFASKDLLIQQPPPPDGAKLSFRNALGINRAAINYTVDVRLLFYWKRNRLALPTSDPFELKSERWEKIIKSLTERVLDGKDYQNPPMVIPTGLTLNLLHDYAPLVWAGGGEFLHKGAFFTKVDLTSNEALQIPEYLANNTAATDINKIDHPVITFPEMSTEEATKHFMDGDFIGIQKPAGFIKRWYEKFEQDVIADTSPKPDRKGPVVFWDYVGITVPPKPFKGGSDLIILNSTQDTESAFALARFLVSNEDYTGLIAKFEGYLPAQVPDVGVERLIESLSKSNTADSERVVPYTDKKTLEQNYKALVNQVEINGKEYPELASFPVDVESRETLEAFQRLLRRIGEGKSNNSESKNVKEAAGEAEFVINYRIDRVTYWKWFLYTYGPWIGTALLCVAVAFLISNKRQKSRRLLLLRLYRGKVHSHLHAYGSRIRDFFRLSCEELFKRLNWYSLHISNTFAPYLERTEEQLSYELEGNNKPENLKTIIDTAFQAAKDEFKAYYANDPPEVELRFQHTLSQYTLARLSSLLTLILQEWFFNCLKKISKEQRSKEERSKHPILVNVEDGWYRKSLRILSPGAIEAHEAKRLTDKPVTNYFKITDDSLSELKEAGLPDAVLSILKTHKNKEFAGKRSFLKFLKADKQTARYKKIIIQKTSIPPVKTGLGLDLIRDYLWYGFSTRAVCNVDNNNRTSLVMKFRLRRISS